MKFAVIGHPINHSLSPLMHHANFSALQLDYGYEALNIPETHFNHIRDIIDDRQLDGFNVTIPHKERIIPYLDDISKEAREMGAVNTVKITNGKWIGYNTDGLGFVKGLKNYYGALTEAKILVLGAGGASKGITYQLKQYTKYPIYVANRTMSRFDTWSFDVEAMPLTSVRSKAHHFDIIINTTPIGMHHSQEALLTFDTLKNNALICDIIYTPLETLFLENARRNGYDTYNGLDMFVYQGAESFKIWTNLDANIEAMKTTVLNQLTQNND
ncbi:shikimate dehydrogenase [Staphylococcus chromogenes]|uniref:shikimate dehydrogenase n=1 Tax=Staphylococcus chromogenes TaxID=46126 RepID=UPI001C3C76CA|nr:shikimate dehydrogenase [Staphylococcus chromogenes]MBV5190573.1 shikimate dehydrogenase [Staphylococcus chromogenes]MBW3132038.1 shikimate dehydrogenase [Staphylococcus chromogenes]